MTEFLSKPIDRCPVCGTNLRNGDKLCPCPLGCELPDPAPRSAA